jgi:hypothetical protein
VKPLPVESQMLNTPVPLLNQTKSSLPLPVKSPTPARLQPAATEPTNTFCVKLLPVDCHSVNVVPFCQIRSLLLSPLKSPMPPRLQPAATEPTKTFAVNPLPVDCHSVSVVPFC